MPRYLLLLTVAAYVVASLVLPTDIHAQTVWSGYGFSFAKSNFADPTLPENQDRLTGNVWVTRATNQGIFNIHDEPSYMAPASPAGTEWATDLNNTGKTIAATNWSQLTFAGWIESYGGQASAMLPTKLIGRNAVVHLIADNVYLDLRFTDWTQSGGGGFSYDRAAAPFPPAPSGDYNGNGTVDAADYVVWRNTLNQSAVPQGNGADGNANGTIDAGDYGYWRARFGNPAGSGSGLDLPTAIPEPAAGALLLVALFALQFGRHRASRGSVIHSAVPA